MRLGARELVFIALLAALPVLAWWFYFKPRQKQRAELVALIARREHRVAVADSGRFGAKKLAARIARIRQAISFLEKKLPNQVEMARMLQSIYSAEQHDSLNIVSQHYLQAIDKTGYSEQPIAMSLEGSFRGFYRFLRTLEHMPRVKRINSLVIRKSAVHKGLIDADFTLSIFFANGH